MSSFYEIALESLPCLKNAENAPMIVKKLAMPALRLGMLEYFRIAEERNPGWFFGDEEVKLTWLLSDSSNEKPWKYDEIEVPKALDFLNVPVSPSTDELFNITTILFIEKLSVRKPGGVIVNMAFQNREDPSVKSMKWMIARKKFEDIIKEKGYEESLLVGGNGRISEGLSSNFFAINADGVIETAPDGEVLSGTLRSVVLDVCNKLGLKVDFKSPSIEDISLWKAAFISSTSRLALPIDYIIDSNNQTIDMKPENCEIMKDIQQKVREGLDEYSVDIFE